MNTGVLRGGLRPYAATVPVSGTSDVTLTGDLAQAQKITFSGTLSGPINAFLPLTTEDFGETWTFVNSTSQTITVKSSATGSGATVAPGATRVLQWTGSDMGPSGSGATIQGTTAEPLVFTSPGIIDAQVQITSDPGASVHAITAWIEPGTGAPLNRTMRGLNAESYIRNGDAGVYTGNAQAGRFAAVYGGLSPGSLAQAEALIVVAGIQKLTGVGDGSGTLTLATGLEVNIIASGSPTGVITTARGVIIATPTVPGGGIGTLEAIRVQNQGVAGITTSYGLRVDAQAGATTTWALSIEGGNSQFLSGATGQTPIAIKAFAGQTGNLFTVADSGAAVRVAVGDLTQAASTTLKLVAIASQTGPCLSIRDSGDSNSDFRIFPAIAANNQAARLLWRFGSSIFEQDTGGGFGSNTRLVIAPNGDQLDILNEAANATTASFKTTTGLALTASDAATNSVTQGLTISHITSGTPAAGFGGGLQLQLQSTTTAGRPAVDLNASWVVATDASRTARYTISVYDTAAREVLRGEASGTAPMIGFLGASAVVRQTLAAAATDAGTTQTLANSLRTALINLGLGV